MYVYKALHMSIHDFPGLKVVEVAHDMQLAVGRYVKQDLKLLNSFDTWHGNCNGAVFMFALVQLYTM